MAAPNNNNNPDMQQLLAMFQQIIQSQLEVQKQAKQLLESQTEIQKLFCPEAQTKATMTGQRRIPTIDKLTKRDYFYLWRDDLLRVLRRIDLAKYIEDDVPAPRGDDEALKQWRADRADVADYIHAMVPGRKVWASIKAMGWNPTAGDPKATYDMVVRYFEGSTSDTNYKKMKEFVTIRRSSFGKMEAYQARINYLRDCLNNTDFKMHDEPYLWYALKGIQAEYPSLYNGMVMTMENGTLTWEALMVEFQRQGMSEEP